MRSWCPILSYMDEVAFRRFVGALPMPTARISLTDEHCFRIQLIRLSSFIYFLFACRPVVPHVSLLCLFSAVQDSHM